MDGTREKPSQKSFEAGINGVREDESTSEVHYGQWMSDILTGVGRGAVPQELLNVSREG